MMISRGAVEGHCESDAAVVKVLDSDTSAMGIALPGDDNKLQATACFLVGAGAIVSKSNAAAIKPTKVGIRQQCWTKFCVDSKQLLMLVTFMQACENLPKSSGHCLEQLQYASMTCPS